MRTYAFAHVLTQLRRCALGQVLAQALVHLRTSSVPSQHIDLTLGWFNAVSLSATQAQ